MNYTAHYQLQLNEARSVQQWQIVLLNDSIIKVRWRDSTPTLSNLLKTISLKNK